MPQRGIDGEVGPWLAELQISMQPASRATCETHSHCLQSGLASLLQLPPLRCCRAKPPPPQRTSPAATLLAQLAHATAWQGTSAAGLTRGMLFRAPTMVAASHSTTMPPAPYTITLVLFSTLSHCSRDSSARVASPGSREIAERRPAAV